MPNARLAAAAVLLIWSGAALAQEPAPLNDLSACRLDDDRVALRFTFEGGACQRTGDPTVEPGKDGVLEVTVPTRNEGEVCTMQIVPVEFSGTIEADKSATSLNVTVLSPEGQPQAAGSTEIARGGDCKDPGVVDQGEDEDGKDKSR